MMRAIRKSLSSVPNKKRLTKKTHKRKQRGGALYSFDLSDKVGGLPAHVSLNGSIDGDCPKGNITDFGSQNYTITKGGSRKSKKGKSSKGKSSKGKSSKGKSSKGKLSKRQIFKNKNLQNLKNQNLKNIKL